MRRATILRARPTGPLTLTVSEAATVLRISRSSAYEAVRIGDIPAIRIGHRVVVPTVWVAEQLGVPVKMIRVSDTGSADERRRPAARSPKRIGRAPAFHKPPGVRTTTKDS